MSEERKAIGRDWEMTDGDEIVKRWTDSCVNFCRGMLKAYKDDDPDALLDQAEHLQKVVGCIVAFMQKMMSGEDE